GLARLLQSLGTGMVDQRLDRVLHAAGRAEGIFVAGQGDIGIGVDNGARIVSLRAPRASGKGKTCQQSVHAVSGIMVNREVQMITIFISFDKAAPRDTAIR